MPDDTLHVRCPLGGETAIVRVSDVFADRVDGDGFDVLAPAQNTGASSAFIARVYRAKKDAVFPGWLIGLVCKEAPSCWGKRTSATHANAAKSWAVKTLREALQQTAEEQKSKREEWANYWRERGF